MLATNRQLSYIGDLKDRLVDWDRVSSGQALKSRLEGTLTNGVTKSKASEIIDWLNRQPMSMQVRRQASTPNTGGRYGELHRLLEQVPEGRYALHREEDAYDFFAVDRKRKRVSKVLGGNIYGATRRQRITLLEQCSALRRLIDHGDFNEARQAYGRELGACGCCGKGLTDPISVSRGIGPDCWVRKGFA